MYMKVLGSSGSWGEEIFQKNLFRNEYKTSFYGKIFKWIWKFWKISICSIIDYAKSLIDYTLINKERFARSGP